MNKWGQSKLLNYWDQPEYWEESSRLEVICYQSKFSKEQFANVGVKNSQ